MRRRAGIPSAAAAVWLGLCVALGCAAATPHPESPTESLTPSSEPLDGGVWLVESAAAARDAGAGVLHVLTVGAGATGDHVSALVNVPAGRCALVMARGSSSVQDVDLFVYGDDGAEFGSDEAADARPSLLLCVSQGHRLFVSARVAEGQGIVAIGAQDVAPELAEAVARAAGARNFGAPSEAVAEAWPGLSEAITRHRRRMGGSWEDQRRVALPVDSRVPTRVSARVGAGTCLDALALTTEEVLQLDIEALDENGRIFGRNPGGLPRTLLVCSAEDARITYQLRPHQGRGLVVLALSSTRPGRSADIDPEFPRAVLIPPHLAKTTDERERPPLPRGAVQGAARAAGRERVRLPWAGGCGRVDVRSAGALLGLETFVWSEAGDLLGQGEGLTEVPLFVCASPGTLRVDVEATRRQGRFVVSPQMDRDAVPPALRAHPLAAGRLLGRLHHAGHLERPSAVGEVRELELTAERVERLALLVPVQRCLDVFVGLGAGALGAELRLLDAASGDELELARAVGGASARACASTRAASQIIAELRVTGGRAVALVATRLLGSMP